MRVDITYKFTRVPWTARKKVPCTVCGKQVRRQKTFAQTINPYNKRADGQVKSYADIYPELKAKAAEWQKEPETHEKCREDAD